MEQRIGRPRSVAAHDAILKSALTLVTRHGFRGVTVDRIAAEAGVGKMTLYRHWPNKAALVMDALLELIGSETAFPPAKTALESLRKQLGLQAVFFQGERGTLIRSLVAEAQADPELARAFWDRWLLPRRQVVRRMMQQAIEEGALLAHIDLDVAIDLLYGSLYYRLLLQSGPIDQHFIEDTFKQFLNGHRRENVCTLRPPRKKSSKRISSPLA